MPTINPASVLYSKGTTLDATAVDDQTNGLPVRIQGAAGGFISFDPPSLISPFLRTTKQLSLYALNQNASGTYDIAPAVAGQTTRLRRFWVKAAAPVELTFRNGGTAIGATLRITAEQLYYERGGIDGMLEPLKVTSVNTALRISLGSSVQVDGEFEYDTGA